METNRRDFIKAGTATMLASGLGFAATAGGRSF